MSTGLYDGKTLATTNQYRSDGDTIPVIAVAQDVTDAVKVGDMYVVAAGIQRTGIVQSITAADGRELKEQVTLAGDRLDVRVKGICACKMAAADVAVGALVAFTTATPRSDGTMGANATGAHIMVEAYANATDNYGIVQLNVNPGGAT